MQDLTPEPMQDLTPEPLSTVIHYARSDPRAPVQDLTPEPLSYEKEVEREMEEV